MPHEKTLQKPLTATELAEAERSALERQERGEKRAVEQYLKEVEAFVQRASKPELIKFLTLVLNGSPEAQKEFGQLQAYFNGQFGKLLQEGATRANSLPDSKDAKARPSESAKPVETLARAPEWNLATYERTGSINGTEVKVLDSDVYLAVQGYKANPRHLQSILASAELGAMGKQKAQARQELEGQKRHIVNSGNYPQGWDSAVLFHEESYRKEESRILSAADPKIQELLKSLSTDKGKMLIENTQRSILESGIKGNIRKGLGIDESTSKESSGEKTTEIVYEKTGNLLRKIQGLAGSINRDIAEIRAQHTTMLRAGGNEAMYQQALAGVPARYEQIVKDEIRAYAKDVGSYLVGLDPTPQIVLQGQRFSLPVGGKNVTLDFSHLGKANLQDKKALKAAFEANFPSVYRESIPQKAFDSIKNGAIYVKDHPAEAGVDVGSVVVSGIVTVLVMEGTGNTSVFVAGPVFTATNNFVSGMGYGMIGASRGKDFRKEALGGINVQDSDTAGDILRKKGFELASNTVLFGTFKGTAIAEKAFKEAVGSLAGKSMTPELAAKVAQNPIFKGVNRIGTPVFKTATEAAFFTYYIATSAGVENAIKAAVKSGANMDEAIGIAQAEFSKVRDTDTFMDYYAYNLGFIIAVKAGTKIGEYPISKNREAKLEKLSEMLEAERRRLEAAGYSFVTRPDGSFSAFDPKGREASLTNPDLIGFVKTNKEVFDLSVQLSPSAQQKSDQNVKSPDSGRSGGKTATNPTNGEAKFANLAKNAAEAEKDGLRYALRDEAVYSQLEQTGISDGAGVREGLMKKSGFEEFEIRDYREGKKQGSNEVERDALKKMEIASEKVAREYYSAQKVIYERLKKGASDKEAFAGFE